MKYFIRAVKYFVYITIVITIILAILVALGFVSSDINIMFSHGWKSVGMILLMFACVSAFYPKFGYCKRYARINGEYKDIRDDVVSYMEGRGYRLESEQDENMTFRIKSAFTRVARVWEDRITLERDLGGFTLEGCAKDVARVASGLEYRFRVPESEELE